MKLKTVRGQNPSTSIAYIEGIVVMFQNFYPKPNEVVEAMLTGHGHLHEGKPRVIFARVVDGRDRLVECTGFQPDPFGFSAQSLDKDFPYVLTPGKTKIQIAGPAARHRVWVREDRSGRTRYRLEGLENVEDFDWWQRSKAAAVSSPV